MTALRRFFILLVVFVGLAPGLASAVQPDEILADSKLEARARGISAGLRCLVCQNQSIDNSNAELARDLRLLVRERLKVGDSDAQVRDFLVRRYGNFILLKPPFELGNRRSLGHAGPPVCGRCDPASSRTSPPQAVPAA